MNKSIEIYLYTLFFIFYLRNDAIEEIENNIPQPDTSDPNTRYDSDIFYTINNITDTDDFCNTYNHSNNYNGLKLGQIININANSFSNYWYIAGFDMEYNHTASDGTVKNNGYGICLIPAYLTINVYWKLDGDISGGYIESDVHHLLNGASGYNQSYINNLKTVLGSHLINRKVLLSSSASSYTWTTSYVTLMSGYQLTGEVAKYNDKYDDGEANYKLPLFNYINIYKGYLGNFGYYWIRGFYYNYNYTGLAYFVSQDFGISGKDPADQIYIRPMIYIR